MYPQLRHLQSMQKLLLLKELLGGYGRCAGGYWSNFSELVSTITCKPHLAVVLPSHLHLLEASEDKAWMNGHGSSGTILRNKTPTSRGQLVGMPALLLVYLWVNSVSLGLRKDTWLNFKGKGRQLKPWKDRLPVFDRCIQYTHTKQDSQPCSSSTEKTAPFFWTHRIYSPFSK